MTLKRNDGLDRVKIEVKLNLLLDRVIIDIDDGRAEKNQNT